MINKEIERSSAIEIVKLGNYGNQDKLRKSFKQTDGKAVTVVHPFFHEQEYARRGIAFKAPELYTQYTSRLVRSIRAYGQKDIPFILFEDHTMMGMLDETITKIGLDKEAVYVVPSYAGPPDPVDMELMQFSDELKKLGLQKTVVLGSSFWARSYLPEDINSSILGADNQRAPSLVRNFNLSGCVGYVTKKFLGAGIYAFPGSATYPDKAILTPGVAAQN